MVWLRMFIADRLIYVELPKTACTHIGKLLALVVPGEQRGKHNKPSQAEFDRRPVFLGSVRNPWAWYVSLWAYGCQQEGMLWEALTHGRGSVRGLGWRAAPIYAGRRWLHSLRQRPAQWQRQRTIRLRSRQTCRRRPRPNPWTRSVPLSTER